MRSNRWIVVLLGAAMVASLAPALVAHHSVTAEFDTNNKVTFTGTVKKVDWGNPHIYVHVEVKEEGKPILVYKVEGGAPNAMYRQGIRPETLSVGTVLTCTNCSRSKAATSMNVNGRLTRADGSAAFTSPGAQ
jgi:hypothetical protein